MMKRKIAILGSTGSIGTQTLQVISENPDRFEAYLLTANNNVELLIEQARLFSPEIVVIANKSKYEVLKEALADLPIKVWAGAEAIEDAVQMDEITMVVTAMVGYAGLKPTIAALKAKKAIALANKETLVVAGELIIQLALENKAPIIPVDSEHSAIFQCLNGEWKNPIEKILLTASGGPFRTLSIDELSKVTKAQALKHPNWNMGAKVTIDSASLMNKGFEMIEAKWLFDLAPEQIEILVHPQSIVHSMVQFQDGAVMAQLGLPDMKLPISYALSYPDRLPNNWGRIDFLTYNTLTFEKPDMERFRNLSFAFEAVRKGGNMPCILNAANEIVVQAFLEDRVGFLQMSEIIEEVMSKAHYINEPTLDDYVETDKNIRQTTNELI